MGKLIKETDKFLKEGLSVEEAKVSTLMILLIVGFGFAMFQVFTTGDISPNLLQLLFMLVGTVGGINVANRFTQKNGLNYTSSNYDRNGMTIESHKETEQKYDDRI